MVLMHSIPSLAEFREHRYDPVEQGLGFLILFRRDGPANLQNILHRAAFQRRTPRNLEVPPPVAVGPFSVALGNVQWYRLGRA